MSTMVLGEDFWYCVKLDDALSKNFEKSLMDIIKENINYALSSTSAWGVGQFRFFLE